MTAVYIVGALLWAYVLLRLLRRIADRRKALAAWQARRAERDRQWWQAEAERAELWRELQHVMCMVKLEGWQQ
jgi:hypothetical protein